MASTGPCAPIPCWHVVAHYDLAWLLQLAEVKGKVPRLILTFRTMAVRARTMSKQTARVSTIGKGIPKALVFAVDTRIALFGRVLFL